MINKKINLFLNKFVQLVEENHQIITEYFMNDLLRNNDTTAYRSVDKNTIYQSSNMIYRNLSIWISKSFTKESIKERYINLGKERFCMAIPFPQVQKAMVLQKRYLWIFVMENMEEELIDYIEAQKLSNRVGLYFDRAIFFMLKGYDEEINKKF